MTVWCPGCSREVEGVCHHFNCAIGPNGLAAQLRSSAATDDLIERLRNPMWANSTAPFPSPQLEQEENLAAMNEAAAEIERLRAVPQTAAWPIATAPKDGTEFIGYQNGDVFRCCWRTEEPDEGPGRSGWYDFSNQSFEDPTEWSPLPASLALPRPK